MKNNGVRKLTAAAVVGALYFVLTILLEPISYGPVQFRISEVLCILPFFSPGAAWGLTVGCILANALGPYGPLDVICGSAATLLAAFCTAAIGKKARGKGASISQTREGDLLRAANGKKVLGKETVGWSACVLGCLMPVLFNGIVVGAELAWVSIADRSLFWETFAIYAAEVAGGEAAVLFALGLPAMRYLLRNEKLGGMLRELQ